MSDRVIEFTPSLPYLKNSVNPDNVSKGYQLLSRKKSMPAFEKYHADKNDNKDPLPSFLKVPVNITHIRECTTVLEWP